MEKTEVRPVLVRIEEETYRQLRHALIDRRETFNGLINKLIDEHMAGTKGLLSPGELERV